MEEVYGDDALFQVGLVKGGSMTDTEINIAIAEVRGFTHIELGPYDGHPFGIEPGETKPFTKVRCPNYCSDLNAMNEAEKYFDDKPSDVRSLWLDNLAICLPWPETKNAAELRFEVSYLQARSNARQRAEAFLRTIGKWKE